MSWKYEATKKEIGPIDVFIVGDEGKETMLKNTGYHSPDGFQMGYAGSGPADLAYSILVDYFIQTLMPSGHIDFESLKMRVEVLHQKFKDDFIVGAKEFLIINSDTIKLWLEEYGNNCDR